MTLMMEYGVEVHLSEGDIAVDSMKNPTVVQICIKQLKTNPFRKGMLVYVGRTGRELCPVAAMTAYLAIRGRAPGPFFFMPGGVPLSRDTRVKKVREALGLSGVEVDRYSGHSFRIGVATTATTAGVEDSLIRTLSRWRSAAYLTYIRAPKETLASVSRLIAE